MKRFPAKLLLFGEYTVINGGSALAIPFSKYSGCWKQQEQSSLIPFFEYLKTLNGCDESLIDQAIKQNWVFASDIPLGYGLGSSGSLSAAAYDAFFTLKTTELLNLKNLLAEIESYFHGKSSGLDPLTSYTNKAVHIEIGQINTIAPSPLPEQLTLYDSGIPRNGKPFIKYYLDRLELDKTFYKIVSTLSKLNKCIIREFVNGEDVSQSFFEISSLQYEFFQNMIPEAVLKDWKRGLDSGQYAMKLSGAGGGGYFLRWDAST